MFGHSEWIDIQVKSFFSLRHGWTKFWNLLVKTLKHIQIINHTNSNCNIVTSNEKNDIFENIHRSGGLIPDGLYTKKEEKLYKLLFIFDINKHFNRHLCVVLISNRMILLSNKNSN